MQRNLSRRDFLKTAALTGGAAALAACVAPAAPGSEGAESEVAMAPVEIQWWSFPLGLPGDILPHGTWEQERADVYSDMTEGVTISYQAVGWDSIVKVQTSIASGNPPHTVLRASVDGIIQALQSDVAVEIELPQEFQDDLPAGWYEGMHFRGKNYMVPFYTLANGMALNLDIVAEAGVDHLLPQAPERTWNFDDYLTMMQACTFERDDGSQVWGAVFSAAETNPFFYWPDQVLSWNWGTDTVELRDGDWVCKLAEEEGIAWLQWLQDLYFVHGVIPNPNGLSASRWDYFFQKSLLGGIGPSIGWSQRPGVEVDPDTLVVTDTERDIRWIFVQPPTNPGVPHSLYWGGPMLDVNSIVYRAGGANEIGPSIDFALWLSNRENQKWIAQYLLPARVSAVEGVTNPMLEWHYEHYIPYGRQRASAHGGRARETVEQLELVHQKIFLPTPPEEAVQDFCATIASLDWYV